MSAIFGIFGEADTYELDNMSNRLNHLGSSTGIWSIDSNIHFGKKQRGLEEKGISAPNKPIVCDGFINNASEIRTLLGKKESEEEIDNDELIFELYRKEGPEGFRYVNGQFSVALWDSTKQCVVLASDAWGTRPLYYVKNNNRYIFASEYKSILAIPSVSARPNINVLQYLHLTKYVPPGTTCLADVKAVMGGTWIELYGGQERVNYYNNVNINIANISDSDHVESLQQCFLSAVKRQTQFVDKIGVALSGGLDSLMIVAALKKIMPERQLSTYTSGFNSSDDNIIGAAEVAGHYKTLHHEIFLDPEELPHLIADTLWHMEDPIGREEKIYYNITARKASGSVPILLAGHNADALFGGMPRHLIVKLATTVPFVKKPLEEFYDYTQLGIPPQSFLGNTIRNMYFKGKSFPPPKLIGSSFQPERTIFPTKNQPLNEMLKNSLCGGSNANSAIEKIHAGCGVEFNSPFLDSEFVKCAFRVPDRLKIRGLKQKYILRKIGQGIIPDEMRNRKKGLLRLEHDAKFCDVLDELVHTYLSPESVKIRGLFEQHYVREVTSRSKSELYSTDRIYRIWSLILSELWCRIFIDARGDINTFSK